VALLVEVEEIEMDNRIQVGLLKLACLPKSAICLKSIDYRHPPRELEQSRMTGLISGDFIRQRQNLHITGPTAKRRVGKPCPWLY